MPAAIAIPLIVAGVSAGASVYAANQQNNAQNNATNAQLSASDRAAKLEQSNSDNAIRAAEDERDYNRWLTQATAEARQPYLDQLAASIGAGFGSYSPSTYTPEKYTAPTFEAAKPFVAPDPNAVRNDPGFQFELGQGVDAINRTGAARGTLLTGGTLKDAETFGQGLAATRAGEQRDRALQEYSLAETLRSQAFDRNAANKFNESQFNNQAGFNAAQLNNQSAYQAASLANQGLSSRLSALGSLASMALPTGAYPGSHSTTPRPPAYGEPGYVAPSGPANWQPGMPRMGGGPDELGNRGLIDGTQRQFDPQSDPWSWYGGTMTPMTQREWEAAYQTPGSRGDVWPSGSLGRNT